MKSAILLILTGFIFGVVPAQASLQQSNAYKQAYPDTKPKCIDCHVDKIPKKDDGAHELNAYGKAVVKAAGSEKPTVDTYKTVGPVPKTN